MSLLTEPPIDLSQLSVRKPSRAFCTLVLSLLSSFIPLIPLAYRNMHFRNIPQ